MIITLLVLFVILAILVPALSLKTQESGPHLHKTPHVDALKRQSRRVRAS
jgi:hypothetical protein